MRKIKLSFVAMLLLGAVACTKIGHAPGITANVSNAEAADMVTRSVSLNSNGVANVSDDASSDASTYINEGLICGTVKSDTISRHSPAGSAVTYSYNLTYNYVVNCNNNVLDNLTGSLAYSGSFSGPDLSSTNTGSTVFVLAGLSPHATDYVLNGEYKRAGTFQSKTDTTNHGTFNVDIVITNLKITKPARTIASGTATMVVTGSVPKKGTFSYTGTLVFNGDGTATLKINGTLYTINLTAGTKVKV